MLGPALLAYLLGWALLALLRALTVRRGGWSWAWHGAPRGRFKLEFTGWALVLEWRLPGILRSRSVVLPLVARRSTSGARKPRAASLSGAEETGAGDEGEAAAGGDGLTLPVLLFWVGQAAMLLFLACNAWWTLRDSSWGFAAAVAGGGVSEGPGQRRHRLLLAGTPGRSSLHVASRLRPMAFLLPSASASSEGGTADWRYVWCAALLALAAHEYGHARAARHEGVPVQHAGVYLALIIPGAYVLIPDTIKSVNPWARLRVLVAGVAANAALCALVALLLLANAPTRLLTTPDPHGGAVLRFLPPQSPFHAALKPGEGIAALQDVPITDGATELAGLLAAHADATRARSLALLRAASAAAAAAAEEDGPEATGASPPSLAALNATVTRLLLGDTRGETRWGPRLPALEGAGLLAPEAFCTHLDLTEGEEEEGRPVPGCCAFDALVGRQRPAGGTTTTTAAAFSDGVAQGGTTCFAYLPVGETMDAGRERLRLTCLPARELALHSHVLGLLGPTGGSKAARGDRGRPFCFRPVAVPPNILFKITLAHGRVITFEGAVDDVANAAFAAGLAGGRPRVWVRALLPERWAMALDAVLLKGLAALLDVSFSLGALNLLPLYQLDGAHALHEAVRLLLHFLAKRRRGRSSGSGADPRSRLLAWYRRGVVAVGCLFAVNVLLAALAALEQAGLLGG